MLPLESVVAGHSERQLRRPNRQRSLAPAALLDHPFGGRSDGGDEGVIGAGGLGIPTLRDRWTFRPRKDPAVDGCSTTVLDANPSNEPA